MKTDVVIKIWPFTKLGTQKKIFSLKTQNLNNPIILTFTLHRYSFVPLQGWHGSRAFAGSGTELFCVTDPELARYSVTVIEESTFMSTPSFIPYSAHAYPAAFADRVKRKSYLSIKSRLYMSVLPMLTLARDVESNLYEYVPYPLESVVVRNCVVISLLDEISFQM